MKSLRNLLDSEQAPDDDGGQEDEFDRSGEVCVCVCASGGIRGGAIWPSAEWSISTRATSLNPVCQHSVCMSPNCSTAGNYFI